MSPRTVDWLPVPPDAAAPRNNGLRERKKRLLRQQLSDTATELFVERGFDDVRITEIADACGVSEKTVYNYFPTKESLILDRWQSTPTALLRGLADPAVTPIEAALRVLDSELTSWTSWFARLFSGRFLLLPLSCQWVLFAQTKPAVCNGGMQSVNVS